MLIRLLVVVLTLVGPMPFRVCTCAAAPPIQTAAADPVATPPKATTKKSCGCRSSSTHAAPPHAHADCAASPTSDTRHPDRHESDCPATDPSPVVRDAVAPTAVDSSTECVGSAPAVWVQPSQLLTTSVVCRPAAPRASKLPLYITLLSIRN